MLTRLFQVSLGFPKARFSEKEYNGPRSGLRSIAPITMAGLSSHRPISVIIEARAARRVLPGSNLLSCLAFIISSSTGVSVGDGFMLIVLLTGPPRIIFGLSATTMFSLYLMSRVFSTWVRKSSTSPSGTYTIIAPSP